jgi:hypothetical protein
MSLQRMDADTAETVAGVIRLLRRAAELVWAAKTPVRSGRHRRAVAARDALPPTGSRIGRPCVAAGCRWCEQPLTRALHWPSSSCRTGWARGSPSRRPRARRTTRRSSHREKWQARPCPLLLTTLIPRVKEAADG